MATVPSTINNRNFTKEASYLLETIKDIVFAYEDYIIEDLDKYRTTHDWHMYIITLKDGVETPRFFYRELIQTRDINQKCIKNTEMQEYKESDITEYHLDCIDNIYSS